MSEVALGASPPFAGPISLVFGLCILLILGYAILRLLEWLEPMSSAGIVEAEAETEPSWTPDRMPSAILRHHSASILPKSGWAMRKMGVDFAAPVSLSAVAVTVALACAAGRTSERFAALRVIRRQQARM